MTYLEKLKHPNWQKKRLEILNRDEFTCRFCGDKETTLNVHHISYNGNPWEADNNLLITLCQNCHKIEEEQLKESINTLISDLKKLSFMSVSFSSLSQVFETDRDWKDYEPSFSILKMAVDDNEIWEDLSKKFWKKLHKNSKNNLPF